MVLVQLLKIKCEASTMQNHSLTSLSGFCSVFHWKNGSVPFVELFSVFSGLNSLLCKIMIVGKSYLYMNISIICYDSKNS